MASFVSVPPNASYHFVTADERGAVTSIRDILQSDFRANAGYLAFRKEILEGEAKATVSGAKAVTPA